MGEDRVCVLVVLVSRRPGRVDGDLRHERRPGHAHSQVLQPGRGSGRYRKQGCCAIARRMYVSSARNGAIRHASTGLYAPLYSFLVLVSGTARLSSGWLYALGEVGAAYERTHPLGNKWERSCLSEAVQDEALQE